MPKTLRQLTEVKKHPVDVTGDDIEKHWNNFSNALKNAPNSHLHLLNALNMGYSGPSDHPILQHIRSELKDRKDPYSPKKAEQHEKELKYEGDHS